MRVCYLAFITASLNDTAAVFSFERCVRYDKKERAGDKAALIRFLCRETLTAISAHIPASGNGYIQEIFLCEKKR